MADIELVIKISQESYNNLKIGCTQRVSDSEMIEALKNGTPLPKGHGRLKDFDKIEWYGCDFEGRACERANGDCSVCDFGECQSKQVRDLPTIIEADKEESEDKE